MSLGRSSPKLLHVRFQLSDLQNSVRNLGPSPPPKKNQLLKTLKFRQLRDLIGATYRQMENGVATCDLSRITCKLNSVYFGLQTEKNRSIVSTHPPNQRAAITLGFATHSSLVSTSQEHSKYTKNKNLMPYTISTCIIIIIIIIIILS